MTITVTVERLLEFESDVASWGFRQAGELERLMKLHRPDRRELLKGIDAWVASNPMPKLIPRV